MLISHRHISLGLLLNIENFKYLIILVENFILGANDNTIMEQFHELVKHLEQGLLTLGIFKTFSFAFIDMS